MNTPADGAPVRILVVDDHTLFRRGLTALLSSHASLQVVGDAGDAGEAQRRATELQPDMILLDNHLPGVNGVDALPALRQAAPSARILMLTVSEDDQTLADALRRGAVAIFNDFPTVAHHEYAGLAGSVRVRDLPANHAWRKV